LISKEPITEYQKEQTGDHEASKGRVGFEIVMTIGHAADAVFASEVNECDSQCEKHTEQGIGT
jgi:hypothetical protein